MADARPHAPLPFDRVLARVRSHFDDTGRAFSHADTDRAAVIAQCIDASARVAVGNPFELSLATREQR